MRRIQKGDRVATPRFLNVTIERVIPGMSKARELGYTEPTHYTYQAIHDTRYDILGKSIGNNRMVFGAVRLS